MRRYDPDITTPGLPRRRLFSTNLGTFSSIEQNVLSDASIPNLPVQKLSITFGEQLPVNLPAKGTLGLRRYPSITSLSVFAAISRHIVYLVAARPRTWYLSEQANQSFTGAE